MLIKVVETVLFVSSILNLICKNRIWNTYSPIFLCNTRFGLVAFVGDFV